MRFPLSISHSPILNSKIEKLLPGVKKNVSLKHYTTFKIGGKAKYFFVAKTKNEIIQAIKIAKKFKLPLFILGEGSNILVSDEGFDGLVIKCEMANIKYQNQNSNEKNIFAEAGTKLSHIVNFSFKKNLTGMEWAIGIPGTLGGAIYGNAGAFGKSISELVEEVEVFDIKKLKIKKLKEKDCKFDYRQSIFKKNKNLIILSAILKLKKGKRKEIRKRIRENLKYRQKTQPLNFPSVGSIFKNPLGFSAGKLIEECGLKGKKIGNAQISPQHANFILNVGEAKAKEVRELIKLVKEKVKKKFGISLEEEIQYLGFRK